MPLRMVIVCSLIGALLTGCTAPTRMRLADLPPAERADRVVVLLPADGLEIDAPRHFFDASAEDGTIDDDEDGDGEDVIDWLVDGAVARIGENGRHRDIDRIRASYPTRAFADALRRQWAARPPTRIIQPDAELHIVHDFREYISMISRNSGRRTLGLNVRCALSANRAGLYMRTGVTFGRFSHDNGFNAVEAEYVSEFVNPEAHDRSRWGRRADISFWAEGDAGRTRDALSQGIDELLELLDTDFIEPQVAGGRNQRFTSHADIDNSTQLAALQATRDGRMLVATAHRLHWLDAIQITRPANRP